MHRAWGQQEMWSVRTRTTKDGVSNITMEKSRTSNAEMGSTLPVVRPHRVATFYGLRPKCMLSIANLPAEV